MDIEKIKKELKSFFFVRENRAGLLVNNSFVCFGLDNEDLPILVREREEEVVLSDMAMTYRRLTEVGKNLEDKRVSEYVEKVLRAFGLQMTESKEIFVTVKDESKCMMAMSRLLQALILLVNIDLLLE